MESAVLNRLRVWRGNRPRTLTHCGRNTGKPHEVINWFVLDGERFYIGIASVRCNDSRRLAEVHAHR